MNEAKFAPTDKVEFWDSQRVKQTGVVWRRFIADKGCPLFERWKYDVCLYFGDGSLVRLDEAQLTAVPPWLWARLVCIKGAAYERVERKTA